MQNPCNREFIEPAVFTIISLGQIRSSRVIIKDGLNAGRDRGLCHFRLGEQHGGIPLKAVGMVDQGLQALVNSLTLAQIRTQFILINERLDAFKVHAFWHSHKAVLQLDTSRVQISGAVFF